MAKKKDKGLDTRVSIHIKSLRHRLTDPDGVSGKAAIDGLVHAGILQDDRSDNVSGVSYSQEKVSKEDWEITIITGE